MSGEVIYPGLPPILLNRKENINNDSRTPNSKVKLLNKKEEVYCVTVSTGLILVRGTNGKTTICGNCAMLEHGTIYLQIPFEYKNSQSDIANKYKMNPYSKVNSKLKNLIPIYYISTNLRALIENDWLDDLQYLCEPTEYHEKRIGVRFICDRGVSHKQFVA